MVRLGAMCRVGIGFIVFRKIATGVCKQQTPVAIFWLSDSHPRWTLVILRYMLDLSQFDFLAFDCFGTLIDWETGILAALRPVLQAHGKGGSHLPSDAQIVAIYATLEAELEQEPYRPYRKVLQEAVRGLGREFGFTASDAEMNSLPDSLALWLPFPDTVPALARLKRRYRLGVLSNVDDDLFAAAHLRLGNPFELVVTAQQVGSYKPSLNNFRALLHRVGQLGIPPNRLLHVAHSRFHDIVPAKSLGLATVWVTRKPIPSDPATQDWAGATPASSAEADLVVPDLAALADLVPTLA